MFQQRNQITPTTLEQGHMQKRPGAGRRRSRRRSRTVVKRERSRMKQGKRKARITVLGAAPDGKLKKVIHITRLANLNSIIKSRFEGNATECAKVLERSHAYLWQLLNEYRGIGEDFARYIEKKLKLPEMSLDERRSTERREEVPIVMEDGKEPVTYFLAPLVTLDKLRHVSFKKAERVVPCPVPNVKAVCFEMIETYLKGWGNPKEVAFVDPFDRTPPKHGCVYVLFSLRSPEVAEVRIADGRGGGRFRFIIPGDDPPAPYDLSQVEVYGRVVGVTRDLACA